MVIGVAAHCVVYITELVVLDLQKVGKEAWNPRPVYISELITDGYKGYNVIGKEMKHEVINRSEQWEEGEVHTNTIEGFWSFVKRAWYGSHHHYSTGYTPLYLAEACYKYNYREENIFYKFLSELWEHQNV